MSSTKCDSVGQVRHRILVLLNQKARRSGINVAANSTNLKTVSKHSFVNRLEKFVWSFEEPKSEHVQQGHEEASLKWNTPTVNKAIPLNLT